MEKYPFIFSNERKYRIGRHFAFWFSWWLFTAIIYSAGYGPAISGYAVSLMRSAVAALIFLPMHIFLAYSLMYFVIPAFILNGRYVKAVIAVILLFIASAFLSVFLNLTIISAASDWFQTKSLLDYPLRVRIVLGLMAGLRGGITVGGFAAAIKLMKYWYVKEQRNIQLQKENIASQLQLLKAQVHPHFLFNTLNNIYSHTQKISSTASSLVMGLSDMLRYILYEGSKQWVPLSNELKMIEDYIMLERIRYGNRLDINKEIPLDTNGLVIAPLLLLPFVENCFKHGTSNILEQPWIRLLIELDGKKMKMTLINARVPQNEHEIAGIGITNVRKRLELLYPGKQELVITKEEDVFIVNLKIELEMKFPSLSKKEKIEEAAHA